MHFYEARSDIPIYTKGNILFLYNSRRNMKIQKESVYMSYLIFISLNTPSLFHGKIMSEKYLILQIAYIAVFIAFCYHKFCHYVDAKIYKK